MGVHGMSSTSELNWCYHAISGISISRSPSGRFDTESREYLGWGRQGSRLSSLVLPVNVLGQEHVDMGVFSGAAHHADLKSRSGQGSTTASVWIQFWKKSPPPHPPLAIPAGVRSARVAPTPAE